MAEPLPKSPRMARALDEIFGGNREQDIRANRCRPAPLGCGKQADPSGFRDERSRREFRISGLCQACQDAAFARLEE